MQPWLQRLPLPTANSENDPYLRCQYPNRTVHGTLPVCLLPERRKMEPAGRAEVAALFHNTFQCPLCNCLAADHSDAPAGDSALRRLAAEVYRHSSCRRHLYDGDGISRTYDGIPGSAERFRFLPACQRPADRGDFLLLSGEMVSAFLCPVSHRHAPGYSVRHFVPEQGCDCQTMGGLLRLQ